MITKMEILDALPRIETGLQQYSEIQKMFKEVEDISQDREFQRAFNRFYRVRIKKDHQEAFFGIMQAEKNNKNILFKDTLRKVYEITGKCETSFVSKLVATIDDTKPIVDRFVLKNMGLHLSSSINIDTRIKENIRVYIQLMREYAEIENSEIGEFLFTQFKERYGNFDVSKTKMIDFVLWQLR